MTTTSAPLDVLILGTGFSGTYLLHRLLNLSYNVLAVDSSNSLGGVWNQNTYPGARVDIQVPEYQLSLPELADWTWKERFPGREELQAYFKFCGQRLGKKGDEGLTKHCCFGTRVESATWDEETRIWKVKATDGREWSAKWFLLCVGYAAKPFAPELPGSEKFEGVVRHTAKWEEGGAPDVQGKKVGVVGTGASGVQIIQTIAPIVESLTVFQQTPAQAIPMQQQPFNTAFKNLSASGKAAFFANRKSVWDGSSGGMIMRSAKDDTPSQRQQEFDRLWSLGGFSFWTSNYMDIYTDAASNRLIYNYWHDRIHERISNPSTAQVLAPDNPVHPFGTKRVPLEQAYFDAFNLPTTHLVDLRRDAIAACTRTGIALTSGAHHTLDMLVFATGFDVGARPLAIRGRDASSTLSEGWERAGETQTYLGLATHGFPNLLVMYGPQSPSGGCNGAVSAEVQGDWVVRLLEVVRERGKTRVEARRGPQEEWTEYAKGLLKGTLIDETKSYFWGDNVPGKRRELVYFFGGLPTYIERLEKEENGCYQGFDIS